MNQRLVALRKKWDGYSHVVANIATRFLEDTSNAETAQELQQAINSREAAQVEYSEALMKLVNESRLTKKTEAI